MPREDLSLDQRVIGANLDLVLSHLTARRASAETLEAARTIASLQEQRVALIREKDGHLNKRKDLSALVGSLLKENKDPAEVDAAKDAANQAGNLADTAEQAKCFIGGILTICPRNLVGLQILNPDGTTTLL